MIGSDWSRASRGGLFKLNGKKNLVKIDFFGHRNILAVSTVGGRSWPQEHFLSIVQHKAHLHLIILEQSTKTWNKIFLSDIHRKFLDFWKMEELSGAQDANFFSTQNVFERCHGKSTCFPAKRRRERPRKYDEQVSCRWGKKCAWIANVEWTISHINSRMQMIVGCRGLSYSNDVSGQLHQIKFQWHLTVEMLTKHRYNHKILEI